MQCISCGGADPRCPAFHPEYGFTCIMPDPHSGPHYDTGGGHWTEPGQLMIVMGIANDEPGIMFHENMTREEHIIGNSVSQAVAEHDWRPLPVRYKAAYAAIAVLRADSARLTINTETLQKD